MNKLVSGLLALTLAFGLSGCAVDSSSNNGMTDSNESVLEESTEQASGAAMVGDTRVDSSGVSVTLLSVESTTSSSLGSGPDNDFFMIAKFELDNQTDEEAAISSLLSFSLTGESGRGYDISIFVDLEGNLDGSIQPGRKMLGEIAFDASQEDLYYLMVKPSLFSDGVEFEIRGSDIK
jgi:hypothetical protein